MGGYQGAEAEKEDLIQILQLEIPSVIELKEKLGNGKILKSVHCQINRGYDIPRGGGGAHSGGGSLSSALRRRKSDDLLIKAFVKQPMSASNEGVMSRLLADILKYKDWYLERRSRWNLEKQPSLIALVPLEHQSALVPSTGSGKPDGRSAMASSSTTAALSAAGLTHGVISAVRDSTKLPWNDTRAFYLGRQYLSQNLYDRIHSPPYLEPIEKLWIAYQLLRATHQAHQSGVPHGDIKAENCLLTTWNWLFLSDFHPYKPAGLPYTNPHEYHTFFDDGKRSRCYIAPERFYASQSERVTSVDPSADIFSVGCVIAELFMDGAPLFDYTSLLQYKDGKYDPNVMLSKKLVVSKPKLTSGRRGVVTSQSTLTILGGASDRIDAGTGKGKGSVRRSDEMQKEFEREVSRLKLVKKLIKECIDKDPSNRPAAQKCLRKYRDALFPRYFDDLFSLGKALLRKDFSECDYKMKYLRNKYWFLVEAISGKRFDASQIPSHFRTAKILKTREQMRRNAASKEKSKIDGSSATLAETGTVIASIKSVSATKLPPVSKESTRSRGSIDAEVKRDGVDAMSEEKDLEEEKLDAPVRSILTAKKKKRDSEAVFSLKSKFAMSGLSPMSPDSPDFRHALVSSIKDVGVSDAAQLQKEADSERMRQSQKGTHTAMFIRMKDLNPSRGESLITAVATDIDSGVQVHTDSADEKHTTIAGVSKTVASASESGSSSVAANSSDEEEIGKASSMLSKAIQASDLKAKDTIPPIQIGKASVLSATAVVSATGSSSASARTAAKPSSLRSAAKHRRGGDSTGAGSGMFAQIEKAYKGNMARIVDKNAVDEMLARLKHMKTAQEKRAEAMHSRIRKFEKQSVTEILDAEMRKTMTRSLKAEIMSLSSKRKVLKDIVREDCCGESETCVIGTSPLNVMQSIEKEKGTKHELKQSGSVGSSRVAASGSLENGPIPLPTGVLKPEPVFEGLTILLHIVCCSLRGCRRPTAKLIGLEMLNHLSLFCTDYCRLDRVVPFLKSVIHDDDQSRKGINDEHPIVVARCVEVMCDVASLVNEVPMKYSGYFTHYILDTISQLLANRKDHSEIVQIAIAMKISQIAATAKYFLDYKHMIQMSIASASQQRHHGASTMSSFGGGIGTVIGGTSVMSPSAAALKRASASSSELVSLRESALSAASHSASTLTTTTAPPSRVDSVLTVIHYSKEDLKRLKTKIWSIFEHLWDDENQRYKSVKRALLRNCIALISFYGAANSDIIPRLFTLFNQSDWQLLVDFLDIVLPMRIFVGKYVFQTQIEPCLQTLLNDARPPVLARCLECFTVLTEMKQFSSFELQSHIMNIAPIMMHYSPWVRNACLNFILAVAKLVGEVRAHYDLLPRIEALLNSEYPLVFVDRDNLTLAMKAPLDHPTFNFLLDHAFDADLDAMVARRSPWLLKDQPLYDSVIAYMKHVKKSTRLSVPLHLRKVAGSMMKSMAAVDPSAVGSFALKAPRLDSPLSLSSAAAATTSSSSSSIIRPLPSVGTAVSKSTAAAIAMAMTGGSEIDYQRHFGPSKPLKLRSAYVEPVKADYVPSLGSTAAATAAAMTSPVFVSSDATHPFGDPSLLLEAMDSSHSSGPLSHTGGGDEVDRHAYQELLSAVDIVSGHGLVTNVPMRRERVTGAERKKYLQFLGLPYGRMHAVDKLQTERISTCSFYKNHTIPMAKSIGGKDSICWQPRGRVITQLSEHSDSVNVIRVTRDNLFVATASSDKTVKIWLCDKIHNSANIKSELTYSLKCGEAISMAILDTSHRIAVGTREGMIQVFNVNHSTGTSTMLGGSGTTHVDTTGSGLSAADYSEADGGGAGNGHSAIEFQAAHKMTLDPEEGAVLCMEHMDTLCESMLVFGTHHGNVHGWDIRKKKSAWSLHMEAAMGPISAMAVGPTPHCCIVGTSRGFVVVWDLRFEMPIQMWQHYDKSAIVSLTIIDNHSCVTRGKSKQLKDLLAAAEKGASKSSSSAAPTDSGRKRGPMLFVSTESSTELCAFDLFSGKCRLRLKMSSDKSLMHSSADALAASRRSKCSGSSTGSRWGGFLQRKKTRPVASAGAIGLKISQLTLVYPRDIGTSPVWNMFARSSTLRSAVLEKEFVYHCGYTPSVLSSDISAHLISSELENMCSDFGKERGGVTGVLVSHNEFVITAGRDRVVRYWNLQSPSKSFRISSTETTLSHRYTAHYDASYDEIVFQEYVVEQSSTPSAETAAYKATAKMKAQHQDSITDLKACEFPQNMLLTSSRNGIVKVWI